MRTVLVLALTAFAGCAAPPAADAWTPRRQELRPEWNDTFRAYGATGAFVLYEPASGTLLRSDAAEAAARYSPASTFKPYNALVALETGVVRDPDSVFVWDGIVRDVPAWNRDHTLRSGMEASAVWLYQRVAAAVGTDAYRAAFARERFGTFGEDGAANGGIGDSLTRFWLDGSLRISADEQVRFMDRLRTGTLAFRPDVQATVRDLLVHYPEAGATIVGKTGWGVEVRADGTRVPVGWLVGWVERDQPHSQGRGQVAVFAMRVVPSMDDFDMVRARRSIVLGLLTVEDWLDALY